MKKSFVLLAGVLTSVLAFGAPNPAYVPASAEAVLVLNGLDSPSAGQKQILEALLPDEEAAPESIENDYLKAFFGYSEKDGSMTAKSAFYVLLSPNMLVDVPAAQKEGELSFVVIENPKLDLPAVTAELKARIAKAKTPDPMDPIAVEEKDGWVRLRYPENVPQSAFMGYRAVPGGVLRVSVKSQAEADAIFKGKNSIKGTKSPLLKAFATPKGAEGISATLVFKSIKGLVASNEESKAMISMQAPYLLKCSTLMGRYTSKGATSNLSLAVSTDDEASANEVREQVIGLKVMASQMLATMLPPESACVKALKAIKVNARGKAASVSLSIPTEDFAKLSQEIPMLFMGMMMQGVMEQSFEGEGMPLPEGQPTFNITFPEE